MIVQFGLARLVNKVWKILMIYSRLLLDTELDLIWWAGLASWDDLFFQFSCFKYYDLETTQGVVRL